MRWPAKRMDELFDIARGGSPRPIDSHLTDDQAGMPWIMIGDTKPGSKYIEGTKKRIKQGSVSKSRTIEPGAFLLTNSMSFGRPYISKIKGCIHDGWLVLERKSSEIDENYFFHVLTSQTTFRQFERLAAGATVKNLNKELVAKVIVPLPPLGEQRRIAAILDQAEELRTKRRATIALLDQLPQAIFLEMFGDPVSNPMNWSTREVRELCTLVRGSSPRPQGDSRYFGGSIPRLMIADITRDGLFVTPRIDSLTEEGARKSRPVPAGTIAMAVSGNIGLVSKLAVDACIHDGFVAFTKLDESIVSADFLLHFLNSAKSMHDQNMAGAIFVNIKTDDIKALGILTPPLSLQFEFLHRVSAVHRAKVAHQSAVAELDSLCASLQANAFGRNVQSTMELSHV